MELVDGSSPDAIPSPTHRISDWQEAYAKHDQAAVGIFLIGLASGRLGDKNNQRRNGHSWETYTSQ